MAGEQSKNYEVIYDMGSGLVIAKVNIDFVKEQDINARIMKNEMQDQLGSAGFLRIHKSFLINMAHVKSLCYKGVTLDDGTSLPISQRNYAAIHATYINWKLNR